MGMGSQFPFDLSSLGNLGPGAVATLRVRIDHQGNVESQLRLTKATEDTSRSFDRQRKSLRATQKTVKDVIRDALSLQSIAATAVKALVSGIFITGFFGTLYSILNTGRSIIRQIIDNIKEGFATVSQFQQSILGLQAIMTSMFEFSKNTRLNYLVSGEIAKDIILELARRSRETIATFEELQLAFQSAAASGLFRFVRTQKEAVDVVLILSNAIAALTPGMDRNKQLTQEMRGFMQGTTRTVDQLGRIVNALLPEGLRKTVAEWAKTKALATEILAILPGFAHAAKDYGKLLEGIRTSFVTIKQLAQLNIFEPVARSFAETMDTVVGHLLDAESPIARMMFRIGDLLGSTLTKGWLKFVAQIQQRMEIRTGVKGGVEGALAMMGELQRSVEKFDAFMDKLPATLVSGIEWFVNAVLNILDLLAEGRFITAMTSWILGMSRFVIGFVLRQIAGEFGVMLAEGFIWLAKPASWGNIWMGLAQFYKNVWHDPVISFLNEGLPNAISNAVRDAKIPEIAVATRITSARGGDVLDEFAARLFESEQLNMYGKEQDIKRQIEATKQMVADAASDPVIQREGMRRLDTLTMQLGVMKMQHDVLLDTESVMDRIGKARVIAPFRYGVREIKPPPQTIAEAYLQIKTDPADEAMAARVSRGMYASLQYAVDDTLKTITVPFPDVLGNTIKKAREEMDVVARIKSAVGGMLDKFLRDIGGGADEGEKRLKAVQRVLQGLNRDILSMRRSNEKDPLMSMLYRGSESLLRVLESLTTSGFKATREELQRIVLLVREAERLRIEPDIAKAFQEASKRDLEATVKAANDRVRYLDAELALHKMITQQFRTQLTVEEQIANQRWEGLAAIKQEADTMRGIEQDRLAALTVRENQLRERLATAADPVDRSVEIAAGEAKLISLRSRASEIMQAITAAGVAAATTTATATAGAASGASKLIDETARVTGQITTKIPEATRAVGGLKASLTELGDLRLKPIDIGEPIDMQGEVQKVHEGIEASTARFRGILSRRMAISGLEPKSYLGEASKGTVRDAGIIERALRGIENALGWQTLDWSPRANWDALREMLRNTQREVQAPVSVLEGVTEATMRDVATITEGVADIASSIQQLPSAPPITPELHFDETKRGLAGAVKDIADTIESIPPVTIELRSDEARQRAADDMQFIVDITSGIPPISIETNFDEVKRNVASNVQYIIDIVNSIPPITPEGDFGEAIVGELDRVAETVDKSTRVMVSSSANLARGLSSAYAMMRDASRMVPDIKPVVPVAVPTVDVVPNVVLAEPLLMPDEHLAETLHEIAGGMRLIADIASGILPILPSEHFDEIKANIAAVASYMNDIINSIPPLTPEADFENVKRAITEAVDYFNRVTGPMEIPPITLKTNFGEVQRSIARDFRTIQQDTERTFGPFATDILSNITVTASVDVVPNISIEKVDSVVSDVADLVKDRPVVLELDASGFELREGAAAVSTAVGNVIEDVKKADMSIRERISAWFRPARERARARVYTRMDVSGLEPRPRLEVDASQMKSAADQFDEWRRKAMEDGSAVREATAQHSVQIKKAADEAAGTLGILRGEAEGVARAAAPRIDVAGLQADLASVRKAIGETEADLAKVGFDPSESKALLESELASVRAERALVQANIDVIEVKRAQATAALESYLGSLTAKLHSETREIIQSLAQYRIPGLQKTLTTAEQVTDAHQAGLGNLLKTVDTLRERGVSEEIIARTIEHQLKVLKGQTEELQEHLDIQETLQQASAVVQRFRLEREGVILPGVDPVGVKGLIERAVDLQEKLGKVDVGSVEFNKLATSLASVRSQLQEIWFGFNSIETIIRTRVLSAFTAWVAEMHKVDETGKRTEGSVGSLFAALKKGIGAAKDELISGFAQAFANFIQGLITGTSGVKAAVGSLIIAIGNLVVSLGVAMMFMAWLIPGQQHLMGIGVAATVAGAGLIAVGAALGGSGPKAESAAAAGGGEVMRFTFNQAMVDVQQGMATASYNLNQAVRHLNTMPPGVIVKTGNEDNGGLANQVTDEFKSGKNFGANLKMARAMQGA